jgi:hypothetical protein
MRCTKGAVLVQDITLDALYLQYATAEQADALWGALASLSKLSRVDLDIYGDGGYDSDLPFFLQSICLMAQVR